MDKKFIVFVMIISTCLWFYQAEAHAQRRTNKRSPVTSSPRPNTLDDEAQDFIETFVNPRIANCSGFWYYATLDSGAGSQIFHQCKHKPSISISGRTFAPRQLSEADRLNGVDPLPIEWEGQATASTNTCRFLIPNNPPDRRWSHWFEQLQFTIKFRRVKGNWEIIAFRSDHEDKLLKFTCPVIQQFLNAYPSEKGVAANYAGVWELDQKDAQNSGRIKMVVKQDNGQIIILGTWYDSELKTETNSEALYNFNGPDVIKDQGTSYRNTYSVTALSGGRLQLHRFIKALTGEERSMTTTEDWELSGVKVLKVRITTETSLGEKHESAQTYYKK